MKFTLKKKIDFYNQQSILKDPVNNKLPNDYEKLSEINNYSFNHTRGYKGYYNREYKGKYKSSRDYPDYRRDVKKSISSIESKDKRSKPFKSRKREFQSSRYYKTSIDSNSENEDIYRKEWKNRKLRLASSLSSQESFEYKKYDRSKYKKTYRNYDRRD